MLVNSSVFFPSLPYPTLPFPFLQTSVCTLAVFYSVPVKAASNLRWRRNCTAMLIGFCNLSVFIKRREGEGEEEEEGRKGKGKVL